MLNQFRIRYPQGSLLSELVQIDHGKYIVRALVQVDGTTLASGLAAADTVEQAEDRARVRALELLNWESSSDSPADGSDTPVATRRQVTQPSTHQETVSPPPVTSLPEREKTIPPQPILPAIEEVQPKPIAVATPAPIEDEPLPKKATEVEVEAIATAYGLTEAPVLSELVLEVSEPVASGSQVTVNLSEPIDFSDVIARSNVELKRLGWTSEQGRNYLLATYGKRSRQLLSDEELLEFLQYLESQPIPLKS